MTETARKSQGIDRRTIMAGMVAAPAVAAAGCASAKMEDGMGMDAGAGAKPKRYLRHQVFFWLKNPDSLADRDKLIAGLESLRAIEVIRELRIGVPAETEARDVVDHSFAVSEMMLFDDRDAQLAYQQHPVHLAFVAECEDLWDRVVVYDSMDV